MLVQDIRSQFFDVIKKSHVLVIVGEDVDALCAYAILSHLFICDDVSYSMVPVSGWGGLERAFQEHYDQDPTFVLLNCGGNRSLQDMQVPEGCEVFVIDSRRPFHHENVFEGAQIRVVVDSAEVPKLNLPSMSDVMEPEESDDSDDDSDNDGEGRGRMERVEHRLLKKSAVRMLELAAALNRATPELMWIAAVGLSSQWTDRLITIEAYHDVCIDRMRPFIHRFSPRNASAKADDLLRVSFEKELPLAMYSHWSLYRAMAVNEHFACKTRNWTQKGDSEVKHLLADLGLTLNESRQKFEAMTSTRRKEVIQTLEKEMTPSFASFIAHFGYSSRVNAADVARGLAVRLESPRRIPLSERFESARSILYCFMKSHQDYVPLVKCFDLYKIPRINSAARIDESRFARYLRSIPGVPARNFPFLDEIMDAKHFLFLFTTFLQRAFAVMRKSRDRTTKPFVVSLALSGDLQGWHIVTGAMPLDTVYNDALLMSFMGRAFERAAEQARLDVRRENFDPNVSSSEYLLSVVLIRSEDRSRFFDLLQAVMEIES
ncbi:unnamed protein product [Nippostrongylus brasiliensis]|uniref:Cell division control protein 45 homolog (inferred by orthology to a human protein) n=1 Tax=Nippostrongylus brasiliensis TaxID=27835 RepID=A0A0N4YLQ2_NIPBR|nr:unnamed protein product [Nippostrongylus brasiliensis]